MLLVQGNLILLAPLANDPLWRDLKWAGHSSPRGATGAERLRSQIGRSLVWS
jgi:hypothetical protein